MKIMKFTYAFVLGGLLFGVVPSAHAMQTKDRDLVIKEQARQFLLILIKNAGKVSCEMEAIFQQVGDDIVTNDQHLEIVLASMTYNNDGLKNISSFDVVNGHGEFLQYYFANLDHLDGHTKKILSQGSKDQCQEIDKAEFIESSNLILALALRGALVDFFTKAKIVSSEFKGCYPQLLSLDAGKDPLSKMLQGLFTHNELLLNRTVLNGFCDEVNKCFATVELPSFGMKLNKWVANHPGIASASLGVLTQACCSYAGHESSLDGRPISFQKLDMLALENLVPQVLLVIFWSYVFTKVIARVCH